MKEIKYTLTPYGAYLTEISPSSSENVIFRLCGEDDAILKIGEKTFEISHGVCFIDPKEIKDGIYVPELITDFGAVRLDTFSFSFGVIKLRLGDRELARVEGELLNLSNRVKELEENNRRLQDAVFGTKLF